MAYLVQKFGGTSLADLERIHRVTSYIEKEIKAGYQVVVVVSAMAGVTNQLLEWVKQSSSAAEFGEHPEADAVLSSGEIVTAGLLALALEKKGIPARSWHGWQLPIITTQTHGNAEILRVETQALSTSLSQGFVAVVTGFQGLSAAGRITTLGRGGSDTTAVALAAFLKAERCDIYTDVEGVYTADPNWVQEAKKLDSLSYEEMLTYATHGAKVLHPTSVSFAQKYQVPVRVLSSLSAATGTWISSQLENQRAVSGVTHTFDWVQIFLRTNNRILCLGRLKQLFLKNKIKFDMMTGQSDCKRATQIFSFVVIQPQFSEVLRLLKNDMVNHFFDIQEKKERAKISVVQGKSIGSTALLRQKMLDVLLRANITVYGLSTSPFQISALIDQEKTHEALHLLHQAYGLGRL